MPYRSPARFLAPVAVIATIVAVLVIVRAGVEDEPAARPAPATTTARTTPRGPSTYTVRAGDTLSAIAERTKVPLPRLERLNRDVDPGALHTGQRLRLRAKR